MSVGQELARAHTARKRKFFPVIAPVIAPVAVKPVLVAVTKLVPVVAPAPLAPPVAVAVDPSAAWESAEQKFIPLMLRVTIKRVQLEVCRVYGISFADLISARRTYRVVRPRQIAMYVCKKLTLHSFPEIGRRFGGRDHTTALWACRRVELMIDTNPDVAQAVEMLIQGLGGVPK